MLNWEGFKGPVAFIGLLVLILVTLASAAAVESRTGRLLLALTGVSLAFLPLWWVLFRNRPSDGSMHDDRRSALSDGQRISLLVAGTCCGLVSVYALIAHWEPVVAVFFIPAVIFLTAWFSSAKRG